MWFLVDMHVLPQWTNKHLLPPHIDDKWGELEVTPRLPALVKWVTKLCQLGLRACHCAEEFTLRWICRLSYREKLADECLWLADPNRNHADSKILTSFIVADDLI
jgi:hypothetical protein